MFILGLVLVVLAVLAALGVFATGGAAAPLPFFGVTVQGTTVGAVFLAGIVVTVVFFIGLALLGSGTRRSRQRRKETKEVRRQGGGQRRDAGDLEENNARPQSKLAKESGQDQTGTAA